MPELPEVETVVRGLRVPMLGRTLTEVRILDPRLVQPVDPGLVVDRLAGQQIATIDRRGKYIVVGFRGGQGALIHLRMTGSFSAGAGDPSRAHVRAEYLLDDGSTVRYHDPRRFGTLEVDDLDSLHQILDTKLGPEPLSPEFSAAVLKGQLRGRRVAIKSALLDQRVVAGLGNIYVDESLHIAGINPLAEAQSISRQRLDRLVPAIVSRLAEAIAAGGSTLRDYRGVEGADGTMQERFLVYGRAGLPCTTCGAALRSAVVGGRTTVWCAHCQRR